MAARKFPNELFPEPVSPNKTMLKVFVIFEIKKMDCILYINFVK
jgi:hypothetical protein